mmetsp:Transcript_8918/g.17295  ORF Transcript_8918/g.17295 Transcript_8918/m.17295 type:complete len:269 (+) Transcript_8918:93-899(+)
MRGAALWYGPSRLASRLAQRNERRSVETVVSKHNTLLEGLRRKSGQSGGHARDVQNMETQIVNKIRSTEAAYFFSDDNYKLRKMAGLDTSSAGALARQNALLEDDVVATRRALWEDMIKKEFSEYDSDHVPPSLKIKVANVKAKAMRLLEQTTLHALDGSELDTSLDDQLLDSDLKMVRSVKKIELGPSAMVEGQVRVTDRNIQKWGPRMANSDLAQAAVMMVGVSCAFVVVKVIVDEKHLAMARRDMPWLVKVLESAMIVSRVGRVG